MAWALNDIKDAMKAHGFTDMLDSDMEAIINDAYFDVCSRDTWPFLEATATVNLAQGTSIVPTPADFGSVIAVSLDSASIPLVPVRLDDITKRFTGMLTSTGLPMYYYFIGDQMNVYPVPDAVYSTTFRYLRIPTRLDTTNPGTSDIPLLPDRHRRVILLGALVSANAMEDDTDLAAWFQGQYEHRLQLMTQDLWKKQWDRPEQMFGINDEWDYIWE